MEFGPGRLAKSGIVSDDMEYDDSDAEVWNPVTSMKKNRTRRCSEMSDSDREKQNESKKARRKEEGEVWKVIVEFEEISSSKLHPVKLSKAMRNEIGSVKQARFLSKGRMLIETVNKDQQEKILKMSTLNEVRIKSHIPGINRKIRGVITGVPIDLSIEELQKEIKGAKVTVEKRLSTRYQGKIVDSLSVLIQFEGAIKDKVTIGYLSYPVREFVPRPLRCFKCQRFGHIAGQCRAKPRCAKCAGEHEYGKCEAEAKAKCCNCGGDHSAAYQGCEAQIKAKEVQKYKVQNKVTYAEAIKQVKGPQGGASVGVVEPSQYSQQALKPVGLQCDVNKDTLIVDKANFVFFMAKVINLAMQDKNTRSDRIKIVVEAAREYLDIKDVTGEMVQDEINRNEGVTK